MLRRLFPLFAVLALALALAPGDAFARAGSGTSMGSRGSMTYSAPPSTATSPRGGAPMQRSMTAPAAPSYGAAAPAPGAGYGGRSPFMSGLLGGLLGAGLGGLLFGHGFFGGITGVGSFLGFLLQIFLIVWIGRMVWALFASRRAAYAGGPMMYQRTAAPPASAGGGLAVTPADYQDFEALLHGIQAAWSAHDLRSMSQLASPEMVSYFAEQMGEQTSRGVRNTVTDVHLEQGNLAEAWSEPGRDYATVAMRFSMIDVTRDSAGRVVEGDPARRTEAVEYWTFLRAPGGRWILSAIQQAG
jgi:predicted lipid-binding transport protein (Tim44 family)